MAEAVLQSDTVVQKLAPTTQAFLRAFELNERIDERGGPEDADEKFAYCAWYGASRYGQHWVATTADEAAIIILLVFDKIASLTEGYSVGDGEGAILRLTADVRAELAEMRLSMRRLWQYLRDNNSELAALKRVADYFGIERS